MDNQINDMHFERFKNVINIDYLKLSKKTDKFRLDVDIKKVKTYNDLKYFLEDYKDYLSYLGKTQIEMIIKDIQWNRTIYSVLAANKFKNLLKKN